MYQIHSNGCTVCTKGGCWSVFSSCSITSDVSSEQFSKGSRTRCTLDVACEWLLTVMCPTIFSLLTSTKTGGLSTLQCLLTVVLMREFTRCVLYPLPLRLYGNEGASGTYMYMYIICRTCISPSATYRLDAGTEGST